MQDCPDRSLPQRPPRHWQPPDPWAETAHGCARPLDDAPAQLTLHGITGPEDTDPFTGAGSLSCFQAKGLIPIALASNPGHQPSRRAIDHEPGSAMRIGRGMRGRRSQLLRAGMQR